MTTPALGTTGIAGPTGPTVDRTSCESLDWSVGQRLVGGMLLLAYLGFRYWTLVLGDTLSVSLPDSSTVLLLHRDRLRAFRQGIQGGAAP